MLPFETMQNEESLVKATLVMAHPLLLKVLYKNLLKKLKMTSEEKVLFGPILGQQ